MIIRIDPFVKRLKYKAKLIKFADSIVKELQLQNDKFVLYFLRYVGHGLIGELVERNKLIVLLVATEKRTLNGIIRTIAHELYHVKQMKETSNFDLDLFKQ